MNGFPLDPSESAPPPLGPAISPHPSPRHSSLGELAEPLAPFGVRAGRPAPPAPAEPLAPESDLDLGVDVGLDLAPLAPVVPEIDAIDSGSGAVDDLPWLELDEPLVESVVAEPDELEEPREPEELPAPVLPADANEWDEWGAAGDTPEEPTPAPATSVADSVAARLEEIARALREHGPAGLLVGERPDPLHLLIAGYALGQAAAEERGRVREE